MENQILDDSLMDREVVLVPADKGKRLVNYLIDYLVIFGVMMFIGIVVFAYDDRMIDIEAGSEIDLLSRIIGMIVYAIYYIVIEGSLKGKSIGKYLTKTRAVKIDGTPMETNDIVARSFSRIVPFEPFSFLGSRPGGWHDRWSKTMVIDETQSVLPKESSWMNRY